MRMLFGPANSQIPSSPILLELYRYWDMKRGARAFPSRADIDPIEIRRVLPHVVLTDVFREPLRLRYRLVGTAIIDLFDMGELTGRWIDEATYGDWAQSLHSVYSVVIDTGKPARAFGELRQFKGHEWITLEDIFLPLGETDDLVTMVMVGVVNVSGAEAEAETPDLAALQASSDSLIA